MGRRHHAHPRAARAARPALPRRPPAAAARRCRASPATSTSSRAPCACELALLHEEDLLRFLADLRASGNAYYSVQELPARAHRPGGDRRHDRAAPARRLRDRPHHHDRPGGQDDEARCSCSPRLPRLRPRAGLAQELGRLFFTPEQRAALDARRRARVPDKPAARRWSPRRRPLDGYVARSSGPSTVWVNGEPLPEGSSDAPRIGRSGGPGLGAGGRRRAARAA